MWSKRVVVMAGSIKPPSAFTFETTKYPVELLNGKGGNMR